jgi:NAD(P)-dependent dehydrogenase (short-subunit alcohol dehydrogenase family)
MLAAKVCVVTGAAGGIGRETAMEMARRGASVVVADVSDDGGRETVTLVEKEGGEALFVHCDVRDEAQIVALMAAADDRFGGIDVLHNNAGVQETAFTDKLTVDTIDNEAWDAVYEVNLRGTWLCTKHATPYLRRSTRGPAIVNSSSTAGMLGFPMSPCYTTTKHAIIGLTRATAVDLAPHIRCNAYTPAGVDTPMIQKFFDVAEDKDALMRSLTGGHLIPRLGEPSDVARLVCFLASDEASWITGSVFPVDGGLLAWRGVNS